MFYKTAGKRLFFLIFLLCAVNALGVQRTDGDSNPSKNVQLTVSIVKQNGCIGYPHARSLSLTLQITLINHGEPLEVDLPLSGVRIVSSSLAAAAAGKHELEMHAPLVSLRQKATPEKKTAAPSRKIVQSGERIESMVDIQLPVRVDAKSDRTALKPGVHYLQIMIDTFPPNTKFADMISAVKRVISEPTPLDVEKQQAFGPACSDLVK